MPKPPGRGGAAWYALVKVVLREEPTCRYCGVWLLHEAPKTHPHKATVDHVVPLAIAPHLALVRDNLAAACYRCNSSKQGRTPEQWKAQAASRTYTSALPPIG